MMMVAEEEVPCEETVRGTVCWRPESLLCKNGERATEQGSSFLVTPDRPPPTSAPIATPGSQASIYS